MVVSLSLVSIHPEVSRYPGAGDPYFRRTRRSAIETGPITILLSNPFDRRLHNGSHESIPFVVGMQPVSRVSFF